MYETIYLVNPIIKVQAICGIRIIISRLPRVLVETIWSVPSTWNVNKGEIEGEYGDDPAVDAGRGHKVQVS